MHDVQTRQAATALRRRIVLASIAGIAAGLIVGLADRVVTGPWATMTNTSATWGLVPFAAGALGGLRGRRGAGYGALCLVAMVGTWTLITGGGTGRELLLWGVAAGLAGALCGWAGGALRDGSSAAHVAGLVVMGGFLAGEGAYGVVLIGGAPWWVELVAGLAIPSVLARSGRDRCRAVVGVVAFAVLVGAACAAYDAVATG